MRSRLLYVQWTVIAHPAVDDWLGTLDEKSFNQVTAAVRELQDKGPALPRPLADTIKGSCRKNMKELRPGSSGRTELRILFAFDTARQAVLLVAGDKSGNWKGWYKHAVPLADDRFDEHLSETKES